MIPNPAQYFELPNNTYRYIVEHRLGSEVVSNTLTLLHPAANIVAGSLRVSRQGLILTSQSQNAIAYDYTYVAAVNGELDFYEIISADTPITVFYQVDDASISFLTNSGFEYRSLYYFPSGSQIEQLLLDDDISSNFLEVYVNGILKRETTDYTFTSPNVVEFLISSLTVPDSFISVRYAIPKSIV